MPYFIHGRASSIRSFLPLTLSLLLFTGFRSASAARKTEYVYLCEGPRSEVYHRSADCKGLRRCSTQTYKVTMDEATKLGRRACQWEYK